MNHEKDTQHNHHVKHDEAVLEHHHTIFEEIMCHLPYAIFSVALAMMFLSFITGDTTTAAHACNHAHGHAHHHHDGLSYRLFHNFHYLHLLFAGTGTVLMFRRYSKSIVMGIGVGFFVPAVFCTLSDAILPYLGGRMLDLEMQFHWCFINHLPTVLPFLIVGMINGWVMSTHPSNRQLFYSAGFHFLHIFISALASVLYLVSFGFTHWWSQMGFVFIYMILAVLIPCTLADIVVPMLFAKTKKRYHKH